MQFKKEFLGFGAGVHIVDEIVFIESKCATMSQCNFQKQSPVIVFL